MSEKMIEKLVDRAPLAILVIGVFVFVIGAAGGLPVGNPPLQITDLVWRIGLAVLGILLLVAGLLLQFRETGGVKADDRSRYQMHKYSGTWKVQNSFSRWRGRTITQPDKVSFNGKTLLTIPVSGDGGGGVQIGKLEVEIDQYRATYEIVNEVQSASVDKDETLRMQVKVIRRHLIDEDPPVPKDTGVKDPYADLRGELKNPNFPLELKPVVGSTPLTLEGSHSHEDALYMDQVATEKYVYTGLFGSPGL